MNFTGGLNKRTFQRLALSEKHTVMCKKCGMEYPFTVTGIRLAIKHGRLRLKQKGHCYL